jgi:hypothetical protein
MTDTPLSSAPVAPAASQVAATDVLAAPLTPEAARLQIESLKLDPARLKRIRLYVWTSARAGRGAKSQNGLEETLEGLHFAFDRSKDRTRNLNRSSF